MGQPIIDADDLALYLNDDTIDVARAEAMIADAQLLCESIVAPLPPAAVVVVKRVAGRAYVTTTTTRGAQMSIAGSQFGMLPGAQGGVFLTRQDRADLRRVAGGSNAFTINTFPADYEPDLPWWDVNGFASSTSELP